MDTEHQHFSFLYLGLEFRDRQRALSGTVERGVFRAPLTHRPELSTKLMREVRSKKVYVNSVGEHPPTLYPWTVRCALLNPAANLHERLSSEQLMRFAIQNYIDNFIYAVRIGEDGWREELARGVELCEMFHRRTGLRPCIQGLTRDAPTPQLHSELQYWCGTPDERHYALRLVDAREDRRIWPALWHEVWCELRRVITHCRVDGSPGL